MTDRPSGGPPIYDVLTHQRACRSFLPDPIPDDVIERILTVATYAPSAENSQPWRFVVVRDADRRRAIAQLAASLWKGGAREHSKPHLADRILTDVDQFVEGGMAETPVIVVVCADTTTTFASALPASMWPCVQNLLLAASAEGLGSALTTLAVHMPTELRKIIDLPAEIEPYAVVPLGYPARELGPPRRRPVTEIAHVDSWRHTD